MTENQELKLQLLKEFAIQDEPKTLEFCRKAYEFLVESDFMQSLSEESAIEHKEPDGIYLMQNDGRRVLFNGDACDVDIIGCIGIGVKWGSRSIVVAVCDQADGETITLTENDSDDEYTGYIDNYLDAVADWNGKTNTEHLKQTGINKRICLTDGWYIPSLGELLFIFMNRRAINEALRYVGGEEITGNWYWSSTEYSATDAWSLYLDDGYVDGSTKATGTSRVRPVSAFLN